MCTCVVLEGRYANSASDIMSTRTPETWAEPHYPQRDACRPYLDKSLQQYLNKGYSSLLESGVFQMWHGHHIVRYAWHVKLQVRLEFRNIANVCNATQLKMMLKK